MKRQLCTVMMLVALSLTGFAQDPNLTSWMINTEGTNAQFYVTPMGGGTPTLTDLGEEANVQQVCYDDDFIYVETEGLAEIMGPCGNPGNPSGQGRTWKIPRNAQVQSGQKTESPTIASMGVLINGVPIYALSDATSYDPSSGSNEPMGDGIWNGDAYYSEGWTLDDKYGGHPQQQGEYHSHAVPYELYKDAPSSEHSPLVGWSWDGYPVYGPYGYTDPMDANSSIKLIVSGYSLRSITQRHTLPDGTNLSPSEYGPNVNASFPLGVYIEDYEYINGQGDLDAYNGRTCVTPEFPDGTYAYFVTMESDGTPTFPYYIGTEYYGVVEASNFGIDGGSTPTPAGVDCYDPNAVTQVEETTDQRTLKIYPNPSAGIVHFAEMDKPFQHIEVLDLAGRSVAQQPFIPSVGTQQMDLSHLPIGTYIVRLTGEGIIENKSIVLH